MANPVILIVSASGTMGLHHLGCRELHRTILCAGVDIATDRFEVEVHGWSPSGPVRMPGRTSNLIDPSVGLWETCRIGRRASRRQRGRARAARRAGAACA